MKIGTYELRMVNLAQGDEENYAWHRATMAVTKNGEMLGTLEPEKRFYKASKQGTSEVGIRVRPNEDLYLNFGGMSDDNQRAVIQAYVFPLVSWIWIGDAGGDLRDADLPGAEQSQTAVCPHGSGGVYEEKCNGSEVVMLAFLIAVAALAQTASEKPSVDVRRVGARLQCQCGCKDSVATCSMLECHFSKPAKERIAQMQSGGHER